MDFLSEIKNRDELLAILHIAIDRIYKKGGTLKKYEKFSTEIQDISNVYIQFTSNQLTKQELIEYFPVEDDLKDCILKAIEVRKPQVCQHLVNIHNSTNIPLMNSFDWDLKFIVGNSSLASFREQRATLILNCQKRNQPETVSLELNRNMVDKMIKDMLEQNSS